MNNLNMTAVYPVEKPAEDSNHDDAYQNEYQQLESLSLLLAHAVRQIHLLGESPELVTAMEAYGVIFELTQLRSCLESLLIRLVELRQENHGFKHAVRYMSTRTDWSTGHNKLQQLSTLGEMNQDH